MESLRDFFMTSASKRGEKGAIVFFREGKAETQISYRKLEVDSNQMANTFLDLGVEKGDRVIIFLPKSLIYVVAYLAIQKIGAIAVPLDPGFKKPEMEYLIKNVNPKLVLSGTAQGGIINEVDPSLSNLVIQTQKRYQDLSFLNLRQGQFLRWKSNRMIRDSLFTIPARQESLKVPCSPKTILSMIQRIS